MMPRILTPGVFVLAVLAWGVAVFAAEENRKQSQEQSQEAPDGPRQEVLELKKAIAGLVARLERIERRISRLEQLATRLEPRAGGAPTGLRPLGSRLTIDRNGIIYDGAHPVGVWGVNGSPPGNQRESGPLPNPRAR